MFSKLRKKKEGFKLVPKSPRVTYRWKKILHYQHFSATQTATAGTVYLLLFQVESATVVDAVAFIKGSAAVGNVTVGIYGPIPTEETCLNAPVAVQSSSTAVAAGVNAPQVVTFQPTVLGPGRYYAAIEFDNNASTFMRGSTQTQVTGWTQTYARAGGYGALTDPCPTPTNTATNVPGVLIRCVV
jgi:hypothetical protein